MFMMMAGLYQLRLCGEDLSFGNLNNPDSDIHKYIAKCSILNMVSMLAGTITINDYVPLKHPSYFFTVDVNNISHEDTTGVPKKWDYRISFPRERLPDASDPISIYEYRHCLSDISGKLSANLAESFRRNVWTELAEKGFGSVKDTAIGFLELAGALSGAKSVIGFGLETAMLFDEVAQNNKKVDNLVELIMNGKLNNALHIGGSVSTTPDGKWIFNAVAIDKNMLNMSLRARELSTGITIGMSADEIERRFKSGTLDTTALADYTSWYDTHGKKEQFKYSSDLIKAHTDCGNELERIEEALASGSKMLTNLEQNDKDILMIKDTLLKKVKQLTYDEMVMLESFFI